MFSFLLNSLKYLAVPAAAALCALIALKTFARCAPICGLLDRPRARHTHAEPIPLVGGLALFCAFFAALLLVFLGPWGGLGGVLHANWSLRFLPVAAAFCLLGMLDDRFDLRPLAKLGGQAAIAVLAFSLDLRLGRALGIPLPAGIGLPATVLWYLVFVNAFNLIDGMDGLAAGLAIVGATGLVVLFALRQQPADVLIMLAMIGACAMFLRYNFHPARIYLGDAGSMLLGAFFASVALGATAKGATVASLGFPLLVVGVPLMDSILAVWRRTVKRWTASEDNADGECDETGNGKAGVLRGDLDHLHHRLARRGHSTPRVAFTLYAVNAFLVLAGLIMILYNSIAVGVAFVSFVILVYVVVNHWARLELDLTGQALLAGLHRPDARALGGFLYPVYDVAVLACASALGLYLVQPLLHADEPFRLLWLRSVPPLVSFPLAALFLSRVYRRMWSRARVSEYAWLAAALLGGLAVGVGVLAMMRGWPLYRALLALSLLYSMEVVALTGARVAPRVLLDLTGWLHKQRAGADARRTAIYGAGLQSTLLLRDMTFQPRAEQKQDLLVGFADDNPHTWRRLMHGHPVMGGADWLFREMEEGRLDRVIVACRLAPDRLNRLLALARETNTRVDRWACVSETLVENGAQ